MIDYKYYLKNEFKDLVEKYVFNYSAHDLFDRGFITSMSGKGAFKDTTRLYWNIMMFNIMTKLLKIDFFFKT